MASGRAWRTLCQKAVTVCPLRMRPEASVTVPLMMRAGARRFFKELVNGKQRGLGVQGVEDGLDQQHVGAAFDQCLRSARSRPRAVVSKSMLRAPGRSRRG